MKNKKKLIQRFCAFLCALSVVMCVLPTDNFSASVSTNNNVVSYLKRIGLYDFYVEKFDFEYNSNYKYFVGIYYYFDSNTYRVFLREYKGEPTLYVDEWCVRGNFKGGGTTYAVDVNYVDGSYNLLAKEDSSTSSYYLISGSGLNGTINDNYIFYTDLDIYDSRDKKYTVIESGTSWNTIRFDLRDDKFTVKPSEKYNPNLGYLKNVHKDTVFDEVPLGEWQGENYTERWYYDNLSTTGVDLTNGNYKIRYYQERWIVKGYEKDDVVDKGKRFLVGDFIVENGYLQTYSEDIESILSAQGYEKPNFFDLWFFKFEVKHYYFQIINVDNGEMGGCVHIYLTDDNGKFGVELIADTLDNDGNVVDSTNGGYSEFIDEGKITTDDTDEGFKELEENNEITLEELFEGFADDSAKDLQGVDGADTFSSQLQSYASQISSVTRGLGVLLGSFPPWLIGLLGVSVGLAFVLIIIKIARG